MIRIRFNRTHALTTLMLVTLAFMVTTPAFSGEITLSGNGWKAWLDQKADWEDDHLYLSPEIMGMLSTLPVNEPTGGWEVLTREGEEVSVPMTMDEYFLNGINTRTYEGVSWVWRLFEVPADWQGNRYTFDGTTWTEVADWVDPKVAEIARLQAQIDALNAA